MKLSLAASFLLAASTALHAQSLTVITHVDIKPDSAVPHASETALHLFHDELAATQHDPGLVHFEILQQADPTNHYTVIETWRDRTAYEQHTAAAHTLAFRQGIQPLLGSPFDARLHHPLP